MEPAWIALWLGLAAQTGLATPEAQVSAARTAARELVQANRFAQAEEALSFLLKRDTRDAESWYLFGVLLYQNGYHGTALPAFDKTLAIESANRPARIYRAVCLTQLGRVAEAEAAFRPLLADAKLARDPELLVGYTQLLYETGRIKDAFARISEAVAAAPEHATARFWRARLLLRLERLADAAGEAERSLALAPQLPFAHSLLLQIYRRQGRSADAAKQAAWLREFDAGKTRRPAQ